MMRPLVLTLVLAGCASAVRLSPAAAEADRILGGPVAQETARDNPEAFAALTQRARELQSLEGDRGAEALEDFRLRLEVAHAQSRERRALHRVEDAQREARAVEDEIQRLDAQAGTLEREIAQRREAQAQAERARVAAQQSASVVPAERAARAEDLRQQAQLLIAASELLGADGPPRDAARDRLTAATRAASGRDLNAALSLAATAYTAAEALLRETRAAHAVPAARAIDASNLTRALSAEAMVTPHQDARGVVAVLRGLFAGAALSPTARGRVSTLARVLSAQPAGTQVRVEVFVGGASRPAAEALATRQSEALVGALASAGVTRSTLHPAGLYRIAGGDRDDDRAEVVLVSPAPP